MFVAAGRVGMHFCPPINVARGQMKPAHPTKLMFVADIVGAGHARDR